MSLRPSQTQLAKLRSKLPLFKEIEAATGVPAEAIAGVWFREGMSVAPPKTPGGPFQFDPPLGFNRCCALLERFSSLDHNRIVELAHRGVDDFEAAAYLCACFLRNKCKPKITPKASDATIMDAMWGYNGRAGYHKSPKGSPYVYNGFDDAHTGLRLKGSIPDGKGGRKRVDFADRRPGAFVVYKVLKGELS